MPSTVEPIVAQTAISSERLSEPHMSATPQGSFQASRENRCQVMLKRPLGLLNENTITTMLGRIR